MNIHEEDPWKIIRKCFGIFLASVVIGVVIPGLFASHNKVFFTVQMEETFKRTDVEPGKTNKSYSPRVKEKEEEREDVTNQLAVVKSRIWDLLTNNAASLTNGITAAGQTNLALADLVTLRAKLEGDRAKSKEVLVPYYTSSLALLWLDTFFTLGVLAMVFSPKPEKNTRPGHSRSIWAWLKWVALPVGLLAFYKWPSIIRTCIYEDPDRLVLYYNAWAIEPWSLSNIWDYCMEFLYCILMIVIWQQWIHYDEEVKTQNEDDRPSDGNNFDAIMNPKRSAKVLEHFVHWIIASVLLGMSFIFDAFFYYGAIADEGDQRYRISAFLELTVWGVSWLIISLPLIRAWNHWNKLRARAVQELHTAKPAKRPEEIEASLKLLEEARPLSTAVVVAAQIGAVGSFLGTLIEQVFK